MNRTVFYHYAKGIILAVVVSFAAFTTALSQTPKSSESEPKQPAKESKPAAKPAFELKVKTRPILNISLKAEKANMADVAQDLSKRLKIPVFLGTERQKEPLSIEFSELMLEPALQLLSPSVYIDYEIETGSQEQPKALGVFLYDTNQGEPPVSAVIHAATQTMLIEGNTEDGDESEEEDPKKEEEKPLRVSYLNYQLSVKAKQQPLPLVVAKIGETIGVPVDIQSESMDVVDANISKLSVEDALRQLSPYIKVFVRADLARSERRVLRLVLVGPPKAAQEGR